MKFYIKDFFSKCDQVRSFDQVTVVFNPISIVRNYYGKPTLQKIHKWI